MRIEQGPIRPPSEAASLLIRVTRNCPWNKCGFCSTYKGKQFSRRPIEDILMDIDTVKQVDDQIRKISVEKGYGGRITGDVVSEAGARFGHLHSHVASWLYFGGKTVFLQDANSLMVKTSDLIRIINHIRLVFPLVDRITTYARANTASRKSVEELRELHNAGLVRIHMGMESGSNDVLKLVQKGVTSSQLVEAAHKSRAAGISLCWYIMPGLGGREFSERHALETAAAINEGNPGFIRFRTLSVLKNTPLYDLMQRGEFIPLGEDEIVKEQRLLLENIKGVTIRVVSDHILNLLQELEGTLPADREKMLGIIDRYLALAPEKKLNYQVGRRAGVYACLGDLENQGRFSYVEGLVKSIGSRENAERELARIRRGFV